MLPRTTLLREDEGTGTPSVLEAFRLKQHVGTSQVQYLRDHIHFISHQGKQILLLELSNCLATEVEKIFRAVPEVVTACPRCSVLILSDFRGASFDQEAIRVMNGSAIFDKPYVKKSAMTGTETLPPLFSEKLRSFSGREFPRFRDPRRSFGMAGEGLNRQSSEVALVAEVLGVQ